MRNPNREVWEGWTVKNFIDDIRDELDMIMLGQSIVEPCKTRSELFDVIKDIQPCYKHSIPEVNEYFAKRYNF